MTAAAPTLGPEAQSIIAALGLAKVEARSRLELPVVWEEVGRQLPYWPVDYSQAMVDYQLAYFAEDARQVQDASLVLFHDNRPAGIWPLMVMIEADGSRRIASHGGPVLPPLFSRQLAAKSVKSLTTASVEAVISIWQQFDQLERVCLDCFVAGWGLSHWHDRWMLRAARIGVQHDLFADLQRPLGEIRTSFRKSFKPLISQGLKLWDVAVVTEPDEREWDEFHELHIAVSGRVTRSDESWQRQLSAVLSGDAFFVVLRDGQSAMVGCALFHVTRDEGLYAVGAYDRSLFDKPLAHVAQFLAIEEMVRRGVRWYRLGARSYLADATVPSAKDISISDFKQGFSSHFFPRFRFDLSAVDALGGRLISK
jgi:FemAB family protein